ncbi:hypothetical protein L1049_019360 [Liquidambar formosana]|uniref:Uncharacterized protein n=1 Tax=Liquidambar formosana TaxID=63359 RepID=A0AAP0X968_LIQFO
MPEGIQPNEARKRAFSQVFGVDGHGRERGVGCGGKPFGGRAAKATAALKEQVEKYKQLYEEEKARREEADCENVAARAEKIEFRENMERFNKCMESVKRHLGGSEVLAAFSQFRFSIQHVQLDSDETQPPDATRPLA